MDVMSEKWKVIHTVSFSPAGVIVGEGNGYGLRKPFDLN